MAKQFSLHAGGRDCPSEHLAAYGSTQQNDFRRKLRALHHAGDGCGQHGLLVIMAAGFSISVHRAELTSL